MLRSHTCGELSISHVGAEVRLCGWVQVVRNHGGLLFADLRDRYGITQISVLPDRAADAAEAIRTLPRESVIQVTGKVIARPEAAVNRNMPTGEIEVVASDIKVITRADNILPVEVSDDRKVGEEVRLKYRYIDLRRPSLQASLKMRHTVTEAIRRSLGSMDFLDIQTPILVRSTPEGARDFVVPSRRYPGKFFALPQSPQLYKQLLMISGFDRYYQIAPCFRDEDQRADRQLMFSQVDLEMSFCDEEDVYSVVEKVVADAFDAGLGVKVDFPFERLSYNEAMDRFGSDKPDLRFGLEMKDITDIASSSDFEVFKTAAAQGGRIRAFAAPGCASMTRKEVDELTELARAYKAKGLVALKCHEGALHGSAAKFLSERIQHEIIDATGANDGDMLFATADKPSVSAISLGQVRKTLGKKLGLIRKGIYKLCWITDFPMFEWNEEEGKWDAMHHIFTSPKLEHLERLESDPGSVQGRLYDLVLNGNELGSGSIRISDSELQRRVMNVIGLPYEQAEAKFGFLLKAYGYGAPIHGGIALGLDRLLAIMLDLDNLKDVIAFPQNSAGVSLVDDCPNIIDAKQWEELHIMPDETAKESILEGK